MKAEQRRPAPPITDEMKAWAAALAAELADWPQVTLRVFFGFTALYRGKQMFALLPRTRSIFKSNAVAFRMESPKRSMQADLKSDPRIAAFGKDKQRWFTFEFSTHSDLHDALEWLAKAFDGAGNHKKST